MKSLICFFSSLLLSSMIFAQNPSFNVNAKDSTKVRMNSMKVEVKIVGNIAFTIVEMEFTNATSRQMEGELIFPLPEGISVSHYAIDINGKMRDAVAVNKSKGKQVFEAIENRRVDPGLLEKVDGNSFRTRIYPIPANGKRTVRIGYEQELSFKDKQNLSYQLFSSYRSKLSTFKMSIEVIGSTEKPKIQGSNDMNFEAWQQNFSAKMEKQNYYPNEKMEILIPIRAEIPTVLMEKNERANFFYTQLFLESELKQKSKPKTIGLIYDVSLSCRNRDFIKEMLLLERYISHLNNVTISVFYLNYYFKKQKDFVIKDGNAQELINFLKNANYDGGTRFSNIKLSNYDEYLFFTDGLSSLSNQDFSHSKAPFYTITSTVSADFSFLNFLSEKTNAHNINLNSTSVDDAFGKLTSKNLRFLGIKNNIFVTEFYPAIGTSVDANFSLAGITLKDKNEITLLFGYENEPSIERTIQLDFEIQTNKEVNVERIWIQKKIANLDLNYEKNKEEIEILGSKAGIVTRNTSLIVLETVQDYISYQILPPAELRAEYDRIAKQQAQNQLAQKQSNWKNIENYFNELQSWWLKDLKYTEPPKQKMKKLKRINRTTDVEDGTALRDEIGDANLQESVVVSPGSENRRASERTSAIVVQKEESLMKADMSSDKELKGKIGGLKISDASGNPGNSSNIIIRGNSSIQKNENPLIVIDGIVQEKSDLQNINANEIASVEVMKGNAATELYGSRAKNGVLIFKRKEGISKSSSSKIENDFYVKAIASQPKEKQYEAYLELRNEYQNNPTFYFDVAHLFYDNGNRENALLVLSSIADLGLENHQLYKTLTYTFREWNESADAVFTSKHVAKWRNFEPQSFRDLALALEDNKQYQLAFDTMLQALNTNYLSERAGIYEGMEDIILMDLNRMIQEHSQIKSGALNKKYLKKMPVDVRIIMNWNMANTDLDLHVIDPTGADCYYANKSTDAGARFSKDFTQGYGPEQYLLRNKLKGKYKITSNYFGENRFTENGPATVLVEIYTQDSNGKTKRELKTIQIGKIKEDGLLKLLEI